jgi:hypothetical protein
MVPGSAVGPSDLAGLPQLPIEPVHHVSVHLLPAKIVQRLVGRLPITSFEVWARSLIELVQETNERRRRPYQSSRR